MCVLSRCLAYEGDVHIRANTTAFLISIIIFFNIVGYRYCPRDVLLVRPRYCKTKGFQAGGVVVLSEGGGTS